MQFLCVGDKWHRAQRLAVKSRESASRAAAREGGGGPRPRCSTHTTACPMASHSRRSKYLSQSLRHVSRLPVR